MPQFNIIHETCKMSIEIRDFFPKNKIKSSFPQRKLPFIRLLVKSLRSGNFTRTQATGANSNGLGCTVNNCLYLANIGLPRSVGLTMRVGNGLSENDTLSADAALCHIDTSLCVQAERRSFDRAYLVDFHRTFAIISYPKSKCKSFLKNFF